MRRSKIFELLLITLIAVMSFIYFYKIILSPNILVHGDYRYALTVDQHIRYHLNDIFVNAPKLPVLMILYPLKFLFGDILAEKLFTVFILFLSAVLVYFSSKHFVRRSFPQSNEFWICLSALIGTLILLFNPWTIDKIHTHYWLVLALASSYALIYRIDKIVQDGVKSYYFETLMIAFLLILSATQVQAILLYFGVFLAAYVIFFSFVDGKVFLKKLFSRKMLLIAIGILFLNIFWILPQVVTLISGVPTPGGYGMVAENVDTLSRRATILEAFRATGGWVWGGYGSLSTVSYAINLLGKDIWNFAGFMPFLIACIPLFLTHKLSKNRSFKEYLLYFGLILTLSIIISTGSYYPIFGDVYRSIFLNMPLGWAIRDPYKNAGLTIIGISYLFSILTAAVITKVKIGKKGKCLSLILISITPLIWGWPILTGDLNGHLSPSLYEDPADLRTTINFLNSVPDVRSYNVLWYPDETSQLMYSDVPKQSSANLNLIELANFPSLTAYMEWALNNNDKKYIQSFLNNLGIRYVILRHDLIDGSQKKRLLQDIQKFEKFFASQKVFEAGNYTVYEMPGTKQILDVMQEVTYSTTTDLKQAFNFNNVIYTPYFKDLIFTSDGKLGSLINPAYFISLKSIHHKPDEYWSTGTMNGGWLNSFLPYLQKYGIKNWQSDYNKGLVFTWASSLLKENPSPNNNDILAQWNFTNLIDLNQWKNYTSENQFDAKYSLTLDNYSLKAELWNSTWGWKTINSPLISADYGDWYRWEFQVRGENSSDVHIKIAERNQEQKTISTSQVKSIGSGNFTWQTITIDYTPKNAETKYIQLQVWHGHETEQPLPNTIWIDNVKIYNLQRFVEPVSLEIPLSISKTGEYVFLTRLLLNEKGGAVQVQLDSNNYTINTQDQLNEFDWEQVGILNLQEGRHEMSLKNIEGFNAVNLFALVPKQQFDYAQKRVVEALKDKTVVYLFEGESDFYTENALVSSKYGDEASSGAVLELPVASRAWRELEILKSDNYTLAIRGMGDFRIQIDGKTYLANSTKLDWVYTGPITLETGRHDIEITYPTMYYAKWDFEMGASSEWINNNPEVQTLNIDKNAHGGSFSLKVELNASTWGWKTIESPLIPVTPEIKYNWQFYLAGENAHDVHVKIVEYDVNETALASKYIESVGSGNFTWRQIKFVYTPSENTSYIQLQVWHGHETEQPLPNTIWIDDVIVYNDSTGNSDLDVIRLYSTQNSNDTFEDVLSVNDASVEIVSYQKVDSTKYVATVNASAPFMLSFGEAYDPLWSAQVNGERLDSIPLFSVVNGFWVNRTGILEITIEYAPQEWFYYGSIVSVAALVLCVAYLTYEWAKNRFIRKRLKRL